MSDNQAGTNAPAASQPEPVIQRKKGGRGALIAVIAVVIVIILIAVVGYSAGWFSAKSSSTTGKGCTLPTEIQLKGDGSSLVNPLMDQWISSYWNGAAFTYTPGGSSAGISAITGKTVDFGASDAPLTATQQAGAPGIMTIPESAGGVVPIFNSGSGLPASLNFNGTVLSEIFDGSITNWNSTALQALNPTAKLPPLTIVPLHRSGGSGTTFIFMSFLSADNTSWAHIWGKSTSWPTNISVGGAGISGGNGGEASAVSTTTGAIGYVDLNYALNSGSGISVGTVQNPMGHFIRASVNDTESALVDSNPVLPAGTASWYNVSLLNAKGAGDYPITSLTYVLVYQNLDAFSGYTMTNAENLVDLLTYMVTSAGQYWAPLLYYAPLTSAIETADLASIASMTLGTATIPVCEPSS